MTVRGSDHPSGWIKGNQFCIARASQNRDAVAEIYLQFFPRWEEWIESRGQLNVPSTTVEHRWSTKAWPEAMPL